MTVSIKDAAKLAGISVIAFCAVFVCTLFLNFNIDVTSVEDKLTSEYQTIFYQTLTASGTLTAIITGGCLVITSGIMLSFYIKEYIVSHSKELGILKALGCSRIKISKGFWVFGLSVFIGCAAGFFSSFPLMPTFYEIQNEEGLLPEYSVHFHPSLFLYLAVLPAAFFSLLSVLYAFLKLKRPVLKLLKEITDIKTKKQKEQSNPQKRQLFVTDLKKATLKSKKSLMFFIAFASFCFSAMVQMSMSMKDMSNLMFALMIIVIGVILACTTLFLAVSAVIGANRKTVAMMKVEGYTAVQCRKAIFDGYRPLAYIGFGLGTAYQYFLLKIMVEIVFKDLENMPDYSFDFKAFLICLAVFAVLYEVMMRYCSGKIRKCPLKQVMEE